MGCVTGRQRTEKEGFGSLINKNIFHLQSHFNLFGTPIFLEIILLK
jgi:hypothetical protein